MSPEQITEFASLFVTIIVAVWHLSQKIQKIEGKVSNVHSEITANLKVIEVRMDAVSEELKASRKSRAELWKEVNQIRERISKLE